MELNEMTKDRIADKLLAAMKSEKLMAKETAAILGFDPNYISRIPRRIDQVPHNAWQKIRAWYYSDKPLREFKPLPDAPDVEAAEKTQQQLDEAAYTGIRKRRSKLATNQLVKEHMAAETSEVREALHEAITESVNTEEPTKEEQAETIRYHYEQVHKVDPNKLDKRTGVLASVELQILPDGSLHITCTYK